MPLFLQVLEHQKIIYELVPKNHTYKRQIFVFYENNNK